MYLASEPIRAARSSTLVQNLHRLKHVRRRPSRRPDRRPNRRRRDDLRGQGLPRGRGHHPVKRHRHQPRLSRGQKDVNRAHARIRGVGERAVSTLKMWKVLVKLRYCPRRATAIVQAILVLPAIEANRYPG
ncbi:hypothetical protein Mro03_13080 [Microbispora rosea subsp. rosea]|nr:hypothetical protein Mro03_13080 [Microbispora rosea subsp. rosea]